LEKYGSMELGQYQKTISGKELTGRDKRAMDYYGKLMPLFYRNDWFGFMTLLRKLIILVKGFNRPFLRVSSHADQRVMVHKSCALAAQTFMLSMASHQYDTCPMEGFDSRLVKKLIDAPAGAEVCMIVACGKGTEEGVYAARTRVSSDEVIRKI
jgi:nitroreductase